jgi:hypothetical protein
MTNPSPGPGYWLASDGKWYPPRWEYIGCVEKDSYVETAMGRLNHAASALGQQGWEMVSHTVQGYPSNPTFTFVVTAFFRRTVVA